MDQIEPKPAVFKGKQAVAVSEEVGLFLEDINAERIDDIHNAIPEKEKKNAVKEAKYIDRIDKSDTFVYRFEKQTANKQKEFVSLYFKDQKQVENFKSVCALVLKSQAASIGSIRPPKNYNKIKEMISNSSKSYKDELGIHVSEVFFKGLDKKINDYLTKLELSKIKKPQPQIKPPAVSQKEEAHLAPTHGTKKIVYPTEMLRKEHVGFVVPNPLFKLSKQPQKKQEPAKQLAKPKSAAPPQKRITLKPYKYFRKATKNLKVSPFSLHILLTNTEITEKEDLLFHLSTEINLTPVPSTIKYQSVEEYMIADSDLKDIDISISTHKFIYVFTVDMLENQIEGTKRVEVDIQYKELLDFIDESLTVSWKLNRGTSLSTSAPLDSGILVLQNTNAVIDEDNVSKRCREMLVPHNYHNLYRYYTDLHEDQGHGEISKREGIKGKYEHLRHAVMFSHSAELWMQQYDVEEFKEWVWTKGEAEIRQRIEPHKRNTRWKGRNRSRMRSGSGTIK